MAHSTALTKPNVQAKLPAETEIDNARAQLTQTSKHIEAQIKSKLDWRTLIQHYPLLVTGIAFSVGAFLGFSTSGEKKASSRKPDGHQSESKPGLLETVSCVLACGYCC